MMVGLRMRLPFASKPDFRAFATNLGWLVADKVTRLFVAVFVSAWVARYLGPERYGVLAYGLTFVSMFQAVSLLGLDNLVVRDIAAIPEQAYRFLGTSLRLRLIAAVVTYASLGVAVAILHHGDPMTAAVILLAGLSIFFQTSDVVDLWFQSQLQSRRTVVAKMLSYLTTAAFKVLLISLGAGLVAFATATAVETGLAGIALYFSYRLFKTSEPWRWDSGFARKLLHQSWPLLLSSLSVLLYMRVSVIFLRESAGNTQVGIYMVGATLSEMWYFLPMTMASSIAPIVSRKRVEGGDAYKRLLFKISAGMWGFSIAVASFNALCARFVVGTLYGHQYSASANILAIHSLTFIPVCIGVIQSIWLINEGRSRLALYQAVAGAIVALGLNLVLTPRFGAYGAAVATVVSQFVQAFLVNAVLAPELFRLQYQSLRIIKALRS